MSLTLQRPSMVSTCQFVNLSTSQLVNLSTYKKLILNVWSYSLQVSFGEIAACGKDIDVGDLAIQAAIVGDSLRLIIVDIGMLTQFGKRGTVDVEFTRRRLSEFDIRQCVGRKVFYLHELIYADISAKTLAIPHYASCIPSADARHTHQCRGVGAIERDVLSWRQFSVAWADTRRRGAIYFVSSSGSRLRGRGSDGFLLLPCVGSRLTRWRVSTDVFSCCHRVFGSDADIRQQLFVFVRREAVETSEVLRTAINASCRTVSVKICNQNIYGLNFFINFANEISFYYITLQNLFYYD